MLRTFFLNLFVSLGLFICTSIPCIYICFVFNALIGRYFLDTPRFFFWLYIVIGGILGLIAFIIEVYLAFSKKLGCQHDTSNYWTNRKRPLRLPAVIFSIFPIFLLGIGIIVWLCFQYNHVISLIREYFLTATNIQNDFYPYLIIVFTVSLTNGIISFLGYFFMMWYAYYDISCRNCLAVGVDFVKGNSTSTTAIEYSSSTSKEKLGTVSFDNGRAIDVYGNVKRYKVQEVTKTNTNYHGSCPFCRKSNNRNVHDIDIKTL